MSDRDNAVYFAELAHLLLLISGPVVVLLALLGCIHWCVGRSTTRSTDGRPWVEPRPLPFSAGPRTPCDECYGNGRAPWGACPVCDGTGRLSPV